MSLSDELDLCENGNILSNKENLLKIGKLLGVESKTCNEIPNNGWNMANMDTEERKFILYKQIFKEFSEKSLTSSIQRTQIFTSIMMYKEQREVPSQYVPF